MNEKLNGCLLRIDNIFKPGTYNNFCFMMDVVNKHNVKVILSITPKWHGVVCNDEDYISRVKEELKKGHILALHGVEHRCRILPEKEHFLSWRPTEDEFDCKDYHYIHKKDIPVEIQQEWLKEGNKLFQELLGVKTDILIPPCHSFNHNTLVAMKKEGFKYVSAYGRWDAGIYEKEGITVLPFDFEDYMKNTLENGGNEEAMFYMFKKYFTACSKQRGYFAIFTHVDFSGEGNASQARLDMLDKMLIHMKENLDLIDPHNL